MESENQNQQDEASIEVPLTEEAAEILSVKPLSMEIIIDEADFTRHQSKHMSIYGREIGDVKAPKVAKFMNTYRLESKRPFNVERVYNVVQEVVNRELANYVYDSAKAIKTCTYLTTEIKSRVKQLDFDRYKIVCMVSIVEKKLQDVVSLAKFLWDSERDRFAVYNFENTNIYVVACVFGIYYD